ncbi:MAG: 23S rRNA (guanosine(2251)-2'-O)-methyltransferase RlmB [Chiayiivirga sp.]|jgi:23S rRNA (guanosine2251-2'-O)-methyltransferase|uniref:23S rRNA (guanosine(2251)-2'-O)-methyltransferase RlmB n=1 Tax=Chiayiivirga sp. TaxID=2041042 RepID=UPI0025C2D1E8|nr:23S rRNA (guanosine(2251)-2'-O)-methyltransferase RlmB [Chiayiivirga sp.]MCI1728875.1 23S rRNA (guanosine(2251)-2'-O)-methyltransferase RlmB [Chiayiivirga sp.]
MSNEWVVGINAVASALENDAVNVREVLVEARARNPRLQEIADAARAAGISVRAVPGDALEKLSSGNRHQGVAANYAASKHYDEHDLESLLESSATPALLLILDGVQDPHNLGACLRSAAAAGATAVVIPKDKSAPVNATVRKTSAGAADRIPIVRVTNLARTLETLKQAGVWMVGLAGEATQSLYAVDLKGPIGIVMGSEGEGMRRLTREHCDYLAQIPMSGAVESLNVSVATGIALFEVRRQRGG